MGTETNSTKPEKETFAEANVSPLHEGEPDGFYNGDISQTLNGNKAIIGKAVWSANSAAVMQREDTRQRQLAEEKLKAESREAQELMRLAEWNAQKINFGGVEMTNAQAQAALQHIIDHEDEYADRAVREGRISANEKEEYKRAAERMRELRERQGRGIATDAEKEELERIQRSRIGQVVAHDVGECHAQKTYDAKVDATTNADQGYSRLKSDAAATVYGEAFKERPEIRPHFDQAATGASTIEREAIAPSPKVAATGFNI